MQMHGWTGGMRRAAASHGHWGCPGSAAAWEKQPGAHGLHGFPSAWDLVPGLGPHLRCPLLWVCKTGQWKMFRPHGLLPTRGLCNRIKYCCS